MRAVYHAGARERPLDDTPVHDQGLGMPIDIYPNDEKQASLAIGLLSIMSVIITALIVMAVLSTHACTV
jgi:hypothetical protein